MRMALLSLAHPGYPEMTSTSLFLCSSFTNKPNGIYKYLYLLFACLHDDIGTNFFLLLSEECFAFRKIQPTETKRKRKKQQKERAAIDDDVLEDLVLSSDEDEPPSGSPSAGKNDNVDRQLPSKQKRKQKFKSKKLKKNKSPAEGKK